MPLSDDSLVSFRKDPLITIASDESVIRAQTIARNSGVHHLPVLMGQDLVGVVCTCDMMHEPPDTVISTIMKDAITLSLQHTRDDAIELMQECGVGSIVLLDGEAPAGIVTRSEVLSGYESESASRDLLQCQCCGVNVHLRTTASGLTLCIFCRGSSGQAHAQ